MPGDKPNRRLRFDISMADDESIPGAIARGVRQHVLVATRPVLHAASVELRHPGLAQLATREELARIAYVIRCDANTLAANAGVRIERSTGKSSIDVSFGPLKMPRRFLELERRRIAPRTLARHEYHRLHWLNLILPYCAESLEQLVDACDACGAGLRWRFSEGVGRCETCGEVVAPSRSPDLPGDLAEDYRLFARLSSPDVEAIGTAIGELPAMLAAAPPDLLVALALQLGNIAESATPGYASQQAVIAMKPDLRAKVAATGAGFLRDFPGGLRDWVRKADEACGGDIPAIARLRARFQRLRRMLHRPGVPSLLDSALPNLARYASHGIVESGRYYLYKQVRRTLRFDSSQMAILKTSSAITVRNLSAPSRRQLTQYDADQIDQLAAILRDAEPISRTTTSVGLPIYAIEQLCLAGLLELEDHAVQLIASREAHVRTRSVVDLLSRIASMAAKGVMPTKCLRMDFASNRIGGGLKPWDRIATALLSGAVPFWKPEGKAGIAHLLVHPEDMVRFRCAPPDDRGLAVELEQHLGQKDAAEILNIKPASVGDVARGRGLDYTTLGRRTVMARTDVITIAAEIAWPGEIAMHLGVAPQKVRGVMSRLGVAQCLTGWDRQRLIREGVLPG